MLLVLFWKNYSTIRYFVKAFHKWQRVKMKKQPLPPSRDNPIIQKLDNPLFKSLFTPEVNTLSEVFKKRNYELRIVGGAVRDILMGIKPTDLDFATSVTPDKIKKMFEEEDIRMINFNGEKHGTITSRINDKENFEITTLRIDMITDGRHAQVIFTEDWKLDALRRDLTINSMFLDLEGQVYDYFFGYDDLQKRRVVFVGDPVVRIREDFLRIFRYFRFYGKVAQQPNNHDEATITAIKENIHGLEYISGERIWSEWSKILSGNYAKELTLKMLECGIARYVGLPENPELNNLETVYEASKKNNFSLQPISLLAVMLRNVDEVFILHKRLKLSAYERDLAEFLVRFREDKPSDDLLKFYKRIFIHWKGNPANAKSYICEILKCKQLLNVAADFEKARIPRFPVNGYMLQPHVRNKKLIGVVIKELKDMWLDKNFKVTTEELLQEVPRIVSEIEDTCQQNKYKF